MAIQGHFLGHWSVRSVERRQGTK